jgi:hypothetical protein
MSTSYDREKAGPAGEDPALVRAWREASDEQPPARLDATILDAARGSVEKEGARATTRRVQQRTRSRWMQWQPMAAAATVAGLAFVLVQTLPRERVVAPPIRIQMPAPATSPDREVAPPAQSDGPPVSPAPVATLESRSSAPAPVASEAPGKAESDRRMPDSSVAGAAPSRPAEAASDVVDAMRSAETDQRKGVMNEAAGEAYSAEVAAQVAAPDAARAPAAAGPPSHEDWAARIEKLHASGDLAAAADALREFRAVVRDADSYLPESLRGWARTVR